MIRNFKELCYYLIYTIVYLIASFFIIFYGGTAIEYIKTKVSKWREERRMRKLEREREKVDKMLTKLMNKDQ